MDVTPLVKEGSKIIQSYAGGRFRVSGEVHEGAILVSQDSVRSWSANGPVQELTEQDFEVLITMQDEFDVVLLGTGKVLRFLAPDIFGLFSRVPIAICSSRN